MEVRAMSIKEVMERKNNEKRFLTVQPLVNIQEEMDQVVLEAEMPGLVKEDITIEIQGDELLLSGTSRGDVPKGVTVIVQERIPVEYKRVFTLGDQIDKNSINAEYENGILKLILKKIASAKPKRITVV